MSPRHMHRKHHISFSVFLIETCASPADKGGRVKVMKLDCCLGVSKDAWRSSYHNMKHYNSVRCIDSFLVKNSIRPPSRESPSER